MEQTRLPDSAESQDVDPAGTDSSFDQTWTSAGAGSGIEGFGVTAAAGAEEGGTDTWRPSGPDPETEEEEVGSGHGGAASGGSLSQTGIEHRDISTGPASQREDDRVAEESAESFPASDPPSWTPEQT